MRLRCFIGVLIALSLFWVTQGYAREVITAFDAEITINKDASLTIIETIEVMVEGNQIKHGIFRDFPTRYVDSTGQSKVVDFTVESVRLDGNFVHHKVERQRNGVRVRIGSPERMVERGKHRYRIKYHTSNQLLYHKSYDELYWNVTGNYWNFPIDQVSATVILPEGSKIISHYGYTGPMGAKGQNYITQLLKPNIAKFTTTNVLQLREGLTIAVAFPKKIVAGPPLFPGVSHSCWALIVTTILVLAYYLYILFFVRRDSKPLNIIPRFYPPDNISPAVTSYIYNLGFGRKNLLEAFSAAIVNLAVKGYLVLAQEEPQNISQDTLDEADKKNIQSRMTTNKYISWLSPSRKAIFTITRAEKAEISELPIGEKAIVQEFDKKSINKLILAGYNPKVEKLQQAFKQAITQEYNQQYFKLNLDYKILGIFLSFVGIFIYAIMDLAAEAGEKVIMLLFPLIGLSVFFGAILTIIFGVFKNKKYFVPKINVVLVSFLLIWGVFFGGMPFFMAFSSIDIFWLTSLIFINVYFWFFLSAFTENGEILLESIEGFLMYLKSAEEKRISNLTPPEMTPEIFEKYLPYAIALGVEQKWADKFKNSVSNSTYEEYQPGWYGGGSIGSGRNLSQSLTGLTSSFSSALASAATMPSSSGGASGGGSSGGGGGGGGGGGW